MKTNILALAFVLIVAVASAKEMTVDGYTLRGVTVSETKTSNPYILDMKFSARVTGGKSCPRLKLEIWLVNNKGDRASITAFAKDVGGSNSRLAEGVGKGFFVGDNTRWEISNIYTHCME